MCRKKNRESIEHLQFKHTPPPPPKENKHIPVETVRCSCGHRLFDYIGKIQEVQIKCPKCKKIKFVNR